MLDNVVVNVDCAEEWIFILDVDIVVFNIHNSY